MSSVRITGDYEKSRSVHCIRSAPIINERYKNVLPQKKNLKLILREDVEITMLLNKTFTVKSSGTRTEIDV